MLERQGKAYWFRSNSFTGSIERSNGSRGFVRNGKPGMPDVVACLASDSGAYAGQFVGFELKTLTGRQSPEQKVAQQAIEKAGGMYVVVRTPEDFDEAIKAII